MHGRRYQNNPKHWQQDMLTLKTGFTAKHWFSYKLFPTELPVENILHTNINQIMIVQCP